MTSCFSVVQMSLVTDCEVLFTILGSKWYDPWAECTAGKLTEHTHTHRAINGVKSFWKFCPAHSTSPLSSFNKIIFTTPFPLNLYLFIYLSIRLILAFGMKDFDSVQ